MQSYLPEGRSARIVAASVLLHGLLLAVLLHHSPIRVAPVRMPGTAHGTRMMLTYLPGPAPSASPSIAHARTPPRPVHPHSLRPAPTQAQSTPQPAPAHENSGSGADALGDGDITIALMQFAPDPKPDLSRLPRGSHGDVVLDAVIDENGRIAELSVKQGIGYGIDESVVATFQQWTFHPALRDGKPVTSRQEFLFHFERG